MIIGGAVKSCPGPWSCWLRPCPRLVWFSSSGTAAPPGGGAASAPRRRLFWLRVIKMLRTEVLPKNRRHQNPASPARRGRERRELLPQHGGHVAPLFTKPAEAQANKGRGGLLLGEGGRRAAQHGAPRGTVSPDGRFGTGFGAGSSPPQLLTDTAVNGAA